MEENNDKKIAILIVVVALIVSLGFFLRGPFLEKRDLQASLQKTENVAPPQTPEVTANQKTLSSANKALQPVSEIDLRAQIEQNAEENQVRIDTIETSPRENNKPINATVSAQGEYTDLIKYISSITAANTIDAKGQIDSSGPLYSIDELSIVPASGGSILEMKVTSAFQG